MLLIGHAFSFILKKDFFHSLSQPAQTMWIFGAKSRPPMGPRIRLARASLRASRMSRLRSAHGLVSNVIGIRGWSVALPFRCARTISKYGIEIQIGHRH